MGSKVISFLNERHLKFEGAEGEIADVRPYGDYLYLVNILIRRGEVNQPASIYVTKDGKLIFLGEGGGIVDLDETSGIDPQNAAKIQTVPPVQAAETEREIDISDAAYVSGPEDAAVVIIEFNDYQCPFCKRFRDQTLDQILEEYEGRIRYVLMDFPITSIHPQAFIAHVAARCAGDQGMYFEYHNKLFSNQGAWSRFAPESEEEVEELKMYASELGLDPAVFDRCLDSKNYAGSVSSNMEAGINAGVSGTPAFFVNGRALVGHRKLEETVIQVSVPVIGFG
jgi:protein-disulfide isomerase